MPTLARLRFLIQSTWHTSYSSPALLVPGLASALLLLFESSILSLLQDIPRSLPEPSFISTEQLHALLSSIGPILFLELFKTIAASQIFLTGAHDILRSPLTLSFSKRCKAAGLYVITEFLFLCILFCASLPILAPLYIQTNSFLTDFVYILFLLIVLALIAIKRLTLGYLILSPIRFQSALHLSTKLFMRHQHLSILVVFFGSSISILFTFLQSLVMIQGVFLRYWLPALPDTLLTYSATLLIGTFYAVFIEIFWTHFFFIVTNKYKDVSLDAAFVTESTPEAPPVF